MRKRPGVGNFSEQNWGISVSAVNALAESQFALFKTELIKKRRPWRTVEEVELATLEWVWWFNNQRLHSGLDYRTPAKVEAAYYAEHNPVLATATHGKK